MEVLSLTIAEESLEKMTNNNYNEIHVIDEEKFLNNLKCGFVVLTQLVCYYESFLNRIINSCIQKDYGLKLHKIIKKSMYDKEKFIFDEYGISIIMLNTKDCYIKCKKAIKVRNEMIHYKINGIGDGTAIPEFYIGDVDVSSFFIKSSLKECYESFIELTIEISKALDLSINSAARVIECAARDGLMYYVYDNKYTNVDPKRFK